MKFMICVIDTESGSGTPEEIHAIDAFNEQLVANGQLIMAEGVQDPSESVVIDNRLAAGEVESGPLYDLDEYLSGFWIISAKDQEQAKELALSASLACNRKVELRPLYD
jgi:hypothetical protein